MDTRTPEIRLSAPTLTCGREPSVETAAAPLCWGRGHFYTSAMTTHAINPRAVRELQRDIKAIPQLGNFIAGRRLRSLLTAASQEASRRPKQWVGVLFHRSLGPIDLVKNENDDLMILIRSTGNRFAMTWTGRQWE